MLVRICSDLHNEFDQYLLPRPFDLDTVLIVAGDVDTAPHVNRLLTFLGNASVRYKHVIFVPGNHEFYNGDMTDILAILHEALDKTPNIYLLDNSSKMIGDVLFLGGTMWTDLNNNDWATCYTALQGMNDFRITRVNGKRFLPVDSVEMFKTTKEFIFNTLDNVDKMDPKPRKTVVVTHHGPTTLSIHPMYAGSSLNPCFAANLDKEVEAKGPDFWFHGHTHSPMDYTIGKTRVIANPRGYVHRGQIENPNFNPTLDIEV